MASIVPYIVLCVVVFGNLVSSLPLQNEIESEDKKPDLFYLGGRTYRNPEELGEYVEGDIIRRKGARNGVIAETARWPNGVIPYEIQGFNQKEVAVIQAAMKEFQKHTCITFRQRTASDRDYISIINTYEGCFAYLGRMGGKQIVNLQSPYCTSRVGIPLHELMHSAGFDHEQNRHDRDEYVTIAWQNVQEGQEGAFAKAIESTTTSYGVPYNYESVMHYPQDAFSKNGKPTIIAKDSSYQQRMGTGNGFTKGDITKLNLMYKCPKKTLQV